MLRIKLICVWIHLKRYTLFETLRNTRYLIIKSVLDRFMFKINVLDSTKRFPGFETDLKIPMI